VDSTGKRKENLERVRDGAPRGTHEVGREGMVEAKRGF